MPIWKNIISILWIGLCLTEVAVSQSSDTVALTAVQFQIDGAGKRVDRQYGGKTVSPEDWQEDANELERRLMLDGYVTFERTVEHREDTLMISYVAGPSYHWKEIRSSEDVRWILARAGVNLKRFQQAPIAPTKLDRAIERSIRYLENHGYPFAAFALDSVEITDDQVEAALTLHKGRFVTIDSVVIEGNLKVREGYLTNFLGIKEGSAYNEKAIKSIPQRLRSVRFLTEVRSPLVSFEEDQTKIRLFLNKRNASSFDGIVGFLPDPSDGSILITGDVKLHLENALRQGEIVDLNWRKLQTRTQELNVLLVTPYVLNSGFSIDGNLKIYRRDTLFTDVFRQLGLRYGFGAGDHLRLFFDRQTSSLISTSMYQTGATPPFLDRAINAYGVGLHLQRLNHQLNPSKGYILDVALGLGSKNIVRNQRLPERVYEDLEMRSLQWKGNIDASYFISPIKRVVWHQRILSSGLRNEQLFNNEAYRIGGLLTLRGFDEESIFATSYSILRSELRYQLDEDGYVFGFFDGAWYENTTVNRIGARRDTPYGFGVGIAFGTPAGNFSLSYALGSQQSNPVQLRASKVHFGFVSLF